MGVRNSGRSDEELVAALVEGDEAALGELYDRHAESLFRAALLRLGGRGLGRGLIRHRQLTPATPSSPRRHRWPASPPRRTRSAKSTWPSCAARSSRRWPAFPSGGARARFLHTTISPAKRRP